MYTLLLIDDNMITYYQIYLKNQSYLPRDINVVPVYGNKNIIMQNQK